ncbi:hypothetical protein [Thermoflavimicrobium dichotomicum]|uniref:Uncharacterized protein n=1 Tax=Thermoflavimicrobium dichotomicum TaxID=46223 RepID=A0A1I3TB27_9BACL|nr:hypothetical protein [Thermoflavimicrobium dichotomicum]SFJ67569.1 hypothetical protein SAMN05421852_11672 [Thermoflavimicrobium dichotomicum]
METSHDMRHPMMDYCQLYKAYYHGKKTYKLMKYMMKHYYPHYYRHNPNQPVGPVGPPHCFFHPGG